MPLRDHFHAPLYPRRHWHSFLSSWVCSIVAGLNRCLPEGYFAEVKVQFGIEFDSTSLEFGEWTPSVSNRSVPIAALTDVVEVEVFSAEGGSLLAGAIELVSPSNKDRPESRDAFVSKCASYLQQGIGLVIVDVVTSRSANLHNELMRRLRAPDAGLLAADLYAVAYHPVKRDKTRNVDLWLEPVTVGRLLPTLPLWLRGGLVLPVDLEAAYERTWSEQRMGGNGV